VRWQRADPRRRARRGGDPADACAEPEDAGAPAARPPDGEEGELVDAAAAPGGRRPGAHAAPPAAERARSGAEEWEVL